MPLNNCEERTWAPPEGNAALMVTGSEAIERLPEDALVASLWHTLFRCI
ncbi:MAG: hypothetical protein IT368_01160 [Candidatus Hydrogenedentes bacterium]|nr:hypothetical protein [Candidatus Hydrogenedentota bacterium]